MNTPGRTQQLWGAGAATLLAAMVLVAPSRAAEDGFAVKILSRGSGERTIRMRFVGADPSPAIEQTLERRNSRVIPKKEYTRLRKLLYKSIYPGIDLASYTINGTVHYDLVVSPGADLERVRIIYDGFENVELFAELPAYQLVNGKRSDIPVTMEKTTESEYGLTIGSYNPAHRLIIPTTSVPIYARTPGYAGL